MKIVRPIDVTDAVLISSSVPETELPYVPGEVCAIDVLRIYQHKIYKSLAGGNTGNTPGTVAGASWWSDQGSTNQRAMFDGVVGTQTVATGSITCVLAPGFADGLAILNVDCTTIHVSMVVAGVTVYDKTTSMLDNREVVDGYTYCFSPLRRRTKFVALDLPPYLAGVVTVVLSAPSGLVKCGLCVIGRQYKIGKTQYDASPGIDDYSKVEFDTERGTATIQVRNFAIPLDATVIVDNIGLDFLCTQMAEFRSKPLVWIGADNLFECLITYGIYRGFRPVIKYLNESVVSLQIKGVI